jgi:hypothetical protein
LLLDPPLTPVLPVVAVVPPRLTATVLSPNTELPPLSELSAVSITVGVHPVMIVNKSDDTLMASMSFIRSSET